MATESFGLEEAYGPLTPLVPADRTSPGARHNVRQEEDTSSDITGDDQSVFNEIAKKNGTIITSGIRPIINRGAGKNSQHPKGTAADFRTKGKTEEQIAALMSDLKSRGYEVIDERNTDQPHIHAERPPGSKRSAVSPVEIAAGSSDTDKGVQAANAQPKELSLEEAYGVAVRVPAQQQAIRDSENGDDSTWYDPLINAGKNTFDTLMDRVKQDFPVLRSEEETEDAVFGINEVGRTTEGKPISLEPSTDRELRWRRAISDDPSQEANLPKDLAHIVPDKNLKGYIANLENPLKLITNDSLPADFLSYYSNLPEIQRKKFDEARKVAQQEDIVANPDKYPAVSVNAAQQAINKRKEKQSPGIGKMWNALKQAAFEDPGKFGAVLTNAIVADPEMIFAPMGLGTKILRTTKMAVTGTAGSSKILKVADKILDAASTGAALNVALEGVDTAAAGHEVKSEDLVFAGLTGAALSGPLGPFFMKGARARRAIKDGNLSEDDLIKAKQDVIQDELLAEDIITAPHSEVLYTPDGRAIPANVRQRIEAQLGIENMSPAMREKFLKEQRAQWRKQYAERWEEHDYQQFKAEERLSYAAERAEAVDAAAREAALKGARVSVTKTREEVSAMARSGRLEKEFDAAVEQRDFAEQAGEWDQAIRIDRDLDRFRQMDEADAIEAAYGKDDPAIKRAMNRAAQKDSKIKMPKWQRGDADPEVLARLGVVGGGVAAGVALAPEDEKMAGGFLGGLVGLLIPGGGRKSILSRMRQSGAVNADGSITGLVLKSEKLANEADVIAKAKAGDQKAFAELYEQYFPRLERAARSYVRDAGPKLGIDPSDIAQDTFLQVFKNIENFKGDSEFYTWAHSIMKNEGLQAIRKASRRIDAGSMHPATKSSDPGSARAGHIVEGEEAGLVRGDVEAAAATLDTPESLAAAKEVEKNLAEAIEKLPRDLRQTLVLKELEGFTEAEIAERLKIPVGTVKSRLFNGRNAVQETLRKRYGADLMPKLPKYQSGEIDHRLVKAMALAGVGGAAGYNLVDDKDGDGETKEGWEYAKLQGMAAGAAFALGLMVRGPKGRSAGGALKDAAEKGVGVASTTLLNISPRLHRRASEHFRAILRDAHVHNTKVAPFLKAMKGQSKENQRLIKRAILTGDTAVTERIFKATGDQKLIDGWKGVRSSLDSLKDQLVKLKRFTPGEMEYFPRIVTDVPGLLGALQKKLGTEATSFLERIVQDAEANAVRKRGVGLSELERSMIINKALLTEPKLGGQPGFAKQRHVKEITEGLEDFYADPAESLHSYIRDAVSDIEKAKFFGKDLQVIKKDGAEYTNLPDSVGVLVENMMKEGKITPLQAEKLSDTLHALFIGGDKSPNWMIQAAKNINYAGLLGNVYGAASQIGDVVIQTYTQGLRPAMSGLVRTLTNRKYVSMKDFGLIDHIAEEFVSSSATAKYVKAAFKYGLFTPIDTFGKNVALNAAVNKGIRLVKSKEGIEKLKGMYGKALTEDEMKQLVKDYSAGEMTDLVASVAWAELSRTQPISKMELPVAYLNNPNGRVLYQYKTFMIKQLDVIRRDFYNEIKQGNIVKGLRNLVGFGAILGISGMPAAAIKDWLSGKPVSLKASDVPLNMLKTFGMSEYVLDHALGVSAEEAAARREAGDTSARKVKATPIGAAAGMITPAYKQFDEIVTGDPKAIRYVPVIGRYMYEQRERRKAEEEAND